MSFSGYVPIDTTKQEIRLVEIEPAEDDELPIRCTLSHAWLKDPSEFTALSYVWGDASITRPIQLNEETFYVTENLFSALLALRQRSEEFVCWIDAICINQHDTSEKNSQVLLMGEIYRACSVLVVWLGDESNDSDLACSLIVKWDEAHQNFFLGHSSPPRTVEDFQGIIDKVGPNAFDIASWNAIDKLFGRPWWRRIWVLQEFAKARHRVFRCGSRVFDSITILSAWTVWDGLTQATGVLVAVTPQASGILSRMLHYTQVKSGALLNVWEFDEPLPLLAFLNILYQTRFFGSTDPKDKLYGIIGLLNFEDCPIKPHYEWSRQQVYTDLFRTLLQTTKKLQILSLCGISTVKEQHTCTLPSWVPHLDCGMSATGPGFLGHKASGGSMAEAYISQSSLSLFTKGLLVSSALRVHFFPSELYPEDLDPRISFVPESSYNHLARALEDIEVCLKLCRGFIQWRYPTGDTILLALFCLLTQKDPIERSSFHLICGYFGVLRAFVDKFQSSSLDEKLFEGGVTEFLHQTIDAAF